MPKGNGTLKALKLPHNQTTLVGVSTPHVYSYPYKITAQQLKELLAEGHTVYLEMHGFDHLKLVQEANNKDDPLPA